MLQNKRYQRTYWQVKYSYLKKMSIVKDIQTAVLFSLKLTTGSLVPELISIE
jgi:hypothetical protein